MVATDAMLKKAPIAFVKSGTITPRPLPHPDRRDRRPRCEESLAEGLVHGAASVLDHVLLADVHPQVYDAILGRRRPAGPGSVAIIETDTVSANVRAAELALKGTPVDLIEIRLADTGLSGKGLSIYHGELHDVEAAVEIVVGFLKASGGEVVYKIISAPHEALGEQVRASTYFGSASLVELEGEES